MADKYCYTCKDRNTCKLFNATLEQPALMEFTLNPQYLYCDQYRSDCDFSVKLYSKSIKLKIYNPKKHGDLIPINEFIDCSFIDNDGEGYYATSLEVSNIPVDLKNIKSSDAKFTHINWYNK